MPPDALLVQNGSGAILQKFFHQEVVNYPYYQTNCRLG